MCDSEAANGAAATDVFCAKAERQQQMFFARKRSANVAAATGVFCAKAERQWHDGWSRRRYHRL